MSTVYCLFFFFITIILIYGYLFELFKNQGSPELLEVKMGTDGYSDGSDDNNRDIDNDNSVEVS